MRATVDCGIITGMSLIDDAVEALRNLPENVQETVARSILEYSAGDVEMEA
jgi:hypothetical protein